MIRSRPRETERAKVQLQQVTAGLGIRRILGAVLGGWVEAAGLAASTPRGHRRLRQNPLDAQGCQMLSGPNVKPPGRASTSREKGNSRAFIIASSGLHFLDSQLAEFMRFGFALHREEYLWECLFLYLRLEHTECHQACIVLNQLPAVHNKCTSVSKTITAMPYLSHFA